MKNTCSLGYKKMQLDVDIEPTLRFPHMISIDKQMDESEGSFFPVHAGIACILNSLCVN